jgi:hypothetical protein
MIRKNLWSSREMIRIRFFLVMDKSKGTDMKEGEHSLSIYNNYN